MERHSMRLRNLSGKEVVARDQAVRLGTVGDILFSPRDGHIGAVMLETAGGLGALVGQHKAIPGDAIEAVGPDAVMVRDRSSVLDSADRLERQGLVSAGEIKGYEVITDQGKRLGAVKDLEFDPDRGRVTGYVVGPAGARTGLGLGREETKGQELTIPLGEDVVVGRNLVTVPSRLAGGTGGPTTEGRQAGYGDEEREPAKRDVTRETTTPGYEEPSSRRTYGPDERHLRGEGFSEGDEPR